jgi:hypothetical protein
MPPRSSLLGAVMGAVLALSSCTGGDGESPPTTAPPSPPPTTAAPWPSRPVVALSYEVAEDLLSVTGRERVAFTPDLTVCELVFRGWPNKPATARTGNSLVVGSVSVDGVAVTPRVSSAGAPAGRPGTLIEVRLPACVDAGTTLTAELSFRLTLGPGTDERIGVAPEQEIAWFGTAFPLLAWERGRGWATEPAVGVTGEMATSEDFRLDPLRVEAPSRFQVMGIGSATGTRKDDDAGTTVHEFSAPAVRDVTVTVGRLQTLRRDSGGVRLHLGAAASGTRAPLEEWARRTESAARGLGNLLGPLPYRDLWISVLPGVTGGVEYPGAVQFGDLSAARQGLVTHEVAHMWFYGLVGNNQARHPWLDESLATFAQRVADGEQAEGTQDAVPERVDGFVGRPMAFWLRYDAPGGAYLQGVYTAGGAALLEARRRSGAEAFDAALRDYVRDNAHRIAVPADLARALAELPGATEVLQDAGALASETSRPPAPTRGGSTTSRTPRPATTTPGTGQGSRPTGSSASATHPS